MQTSVYLDTRRLLDRAVRWLVTNRRSPIDVPAEIARLRDGVARLLPDLEELFYGSEREAHRGAHRLDDRAVGCRASWPSRRPG